MLHLVKNHKWVFIGDSITDAGRRDDPGKLGNGYVRLIHDYMLATAPADAPKICNRGVGGDQIEHLAARWQDDVIAKDPQVVSIMIGINDVWRQLDGHSPGTPLKQFVSTYEHLLQKTIQACPKVQLVLCEPSVIGPPAPAKGNELLLPYVMAIGELAGRFPEHVAALVGMHHICLAAERARPDVQWWPDGVHPSSVGHMLLAQAWLKATRLL